MGPAFHATNPAWPALPNWGILVGLSMYRLLEVLRVMWAYTQTPYKIQKMEAPNNPLVPM